jgi:hypothetical protein
LVEGDLTNDLAAVLLLQLLDLLDLLRQAGGEGLLEGLWRGVMLAIVCVHPLPLRTHWEQKLTALLLGVA